ncbi:MAG: hypothetical protein OEQ53_05565 [Saprospiraceae bacterium]|nr:hypothetical protein [Saprospiraceae bacterium]
MSEMVPIIAIVSVFGTTAFVLYLFLTSRHKERMALIESGQDASIFQQDKDLRSNLKYGFIAIAIGIALFVGHFMEEYTTMEDGAGYFAMIFLLGGLALLLYYRLSSKAQDSI